MMMMGEMGLPLKPGKIRTTTPPLSNWVTIRSIIQSQRERDVCLFFFFSRLYNNYLLASLSPFNGSIALSPPNTSLKIESSRTDGSAQVEGCVCRQNNKTLGLIFT